MENKYTKYQNNIHGSSFQKDAGAIFSRLDALIANTQGYEYAVIKTDNPDTVIDKLTEAKNLIGEAIQAELGLEE